MAVEYRKDRKKWGYRVYLAGRCFKKYAWDTKREAREAEREFLARVYRVSEGESSYLLAGK